MEGFIPRRPHKNLSLQNKCLRIKILRIYPFVIHLNLLLAVQISQGVIFQPRNRRAFSKQMHTKSLSVPVSYTMRLSSISKNMWLKNKEFKTKVIKCNPGIESLDHVVVILSCDVYQTYQKLHTKLSSLVWNAFVILANIKLIRRCHIVLKCLTARLR